MANFSFGFAEGSFLLLNGQKQVSSRKLEKQKRTKRIYQKRRRHEHYKTSKSFLSTGHNFV